MKRAQMPWRTVRPGRRKQPVGAPAASSPLCQAVTSIAAVIVACALAACSAPGTDDAPVLGAQQANTEIRSRIESTAYPAIAGEPLHTALLRRFYARHDFKPVWTTRPAQVASLIGAVLRADDQGLNPDLFHGRLLRHAPPLRPVDRDVLLSDAILAYADALTRGAVPVERRRDDEVLAPDPVDVAALVDAAIRRPDPGAALETLAPATPTYRALRDALQRARNGAPAAQTRIRTIAVNLERQRWLPRSLPPDRAWVNVADQRLVLYRGGRQVFSTRVVVGEDVRANQSPEFRTTINASLYNPPWVIPADIVRNEIQPKIDRDPTYLTRNNMILLAGGEAEQLPGPTAGLGYIMFDMPNRFDVYLHDTPDRYIFNRDDRRLSHGCIRVQDPRTFAALLMQQPLDAVNQGIAAGGTTRHPLPVPVPVFVVYQTAFADADGTLQFRPDFYNRDAEIWQALQRGGQERLRVAEGGSGPVF